MVRLYSRPSRDIRLSGRVIVGQDRTPPRHVYSMMGRHLLRRYLMGSDTSHAVRRYERFRIDR